MHWTAIDEEITEPRNIEEPRTVKELRRCAWTAIARWLAAGQNCPDCESTDGISEEEAAMEMQ